MISIAMTSFNGSKYIRDQLDSILRQAHTDYELIICDDCSTDETWEIISTYCAKDSRIKAFRNSQNIGFTRNFEKAISMCKGDFIALCDQDDIWLPNHLTVLLNNIGSSVMSTADALLIDKEGCQKGIRLSYYTRLRKIPQSNEDYAFTYFFFRNPYPGCNTLYKASFLKKALPLRNPNIRLHDTWSSSLACFLNLGISYTSEITMLYRIHDFSVTSKGKNRKRLSILRAFLSKIILSPNKSGYLKDQRYYYDEITSREFALNNIQYEFLNCVNKYQNRRRTLLGRIQNVYFELKNFRKIYTQ